MSTLKVGTIADTSGSNGSTPAAIANGIAKAWVNFNGTGTVAIRASYNVSSITDNGTGDYTVNFTNAMVDANYSAPISSTLSTTATNNTSYVATLSGTGTTPKTASACRIWAKQGASIIDVDFVDVAIFR